MPLPSRTVLAVSLSQIQSFRRCQQQYHYRYVEKLKRRDRALAPELGIMLHDYLATFFSQLSTDISAEDAHVTALLKVSKLYLPEIRKFVRSAVAVGATELADELEQLPKVVSRIAQRYYDNRGKFDAERYEVVLVEHQIMLDLTPRLRSIGVVDLVTRDRDRGLLQLWEHKSTKSVPDFSYRMRDLQTLLYAEKLKYLGYDIDGVIWNYIRTKEPTEPEVLKSGQLSQRSDMDSTWETYAASVQREKLNLADYEKMQELLTGRELSVFFPRYEQVIVAESGVLMRDYLATARDIYRHRKAWEEGVLVPVRNLSMECSFMCEFKNICNAAVIGGDTADIIDAQFERR